MRKGAKEKDAFEGVVYPKPPNELVEAATPQFLASRVLAEWARATFIDPIGPLANQDHAHLDQADVCFVWSSHVFKKGDKAVVGMAQSGKPTGQKGGKELKEWLYRGWNEGQLPDFLVTICVPFVVEAEPVSICALIEHELYHCGQLRDEYGELVFDREGEPVFTMKGHDIEEFTGVVRRYGAHSPALRSFAKALAEMPSTPVSTVNAVCGCGAPLK